MKSAVMRDAHKLYRQMARLEPGGWDFSRCLRYAWAKHKGRQAFVQGSATQRRNGTTLSRRPASIASQIASTLSASSLREVAPSFKAL